MAVKSSPKEPAKQPARQPRPPQNAKITRPKPPRNNERFAHDLWGVGLVALGLVLLISLLPSVRAGALGATLANGLRDLVGIGAYVIPFLVGAVGVLLIWGREQHTRANWMGGATMLFLILLAWWHLAHTTRAAQFADVGRYGGWVGAGLSAALRAAVGDISSHIVLAALACVAVVWATDMRLLHLFDHAVQGGKRVTAPVTQGAVTLKIKATQWKAPPAPNNGGAGRESLSSPVPPLLGARGPSEPTLFRDDDAPPILPNGPVIDEDMPTVPKVMPALPLVPLAKPAPKPSGPLVIPDSLGNDGTKHEFILPPLELLNESPPKPVKLESSVAEKQAVLMRTLTDFKIGANVSQVSIGPTVTRYEVQLEPGILVKKIVSLADNLAMSLAAIDVRVEAPIPGKAAIGIEVPNDVTTMVSLRECLATNEFMNAPSKLTFALGKDVSGEYKYADLARMPHLLVGGSTNSGKSVCLNVIISSLIYRATPREVKFVMIDPKRVELSLYAGIPHLLAPVVTNVKQAAGIFRSCLKEMEDRYDKFARIGTRNLEGYNSRVQPEERLPFIVLVVDELADLMMQQGPEVETSICRLAQLARDTGIHLIIATQRPSVDVITGTIKANISSRIAFAVATQVDSRT
ncbi:MAG: DNA translocase FtsK, partial [Armatimonadota bacterium]|nr:DNA translocase FtsK [Armatimonadota bacterium]